MRESEARTTARGNTVISSGSLKDVIAAVRRRAADLSSPQGLRDQSTLIHGAVAATGCTLLVCNPSPRRGARGAPGCFGEIVLRGWVRPGPRVISHKCICSSSPAACMHTDNSVMTNLTSLGGHGKHFPTPTASRCPRVSVSTTAATHSFMCMTNRDAGQMRERRRQRSPTTSGSECKAKRQKQVLHLCTCK